MKNKLKLSVFIGITVFLTIVFWFVINEEVIWNDKQELDAVKVNELLQKIKRVNELSDYKSIDTPFSYAVVDEEDEIIYESEKGSYKGYYESIGNRDTFVPIKRGDKMTGLLVIYNISHQYIKSNQQTLLYLFEGYVIVLLFLVISYAGYLYIRVIKPFLLLQNFASQVARGNLDLPLPMDRAHIFGAFTESFDLMREELKKARENERLANESKKELVASLSHDIKTPIASIQAVGELLQVTTTDQTAKEKADIIIQKADQIELLINNLFHSTLEELEQLKVSVSELSSEDLISLIKNSDYQKLSDMSKLQIPGCFVYGDLIRLQQVIDNIIQNSYKYAGTKIGLSAEINDNMLDISFQDFGQSVTKEESYLLCEKFYRASNSEGKSGAGLGLYISSYLMEQMQGNLSVDVNEAGFRVTMSLSLC